MPHIQVTSDHGLVLREVELFALGHNFHLKSALETQARYRPESECHHRNSGDPER